MNTDRASFGQTTNANDDEPPPSSRYLFYRGNGAEFPCRGLPPGYTSLVWLASNGILWPQAKCGWAVRLNFLFRLLLFHLGVFAHRDCGAICIFKDDTLVHYSAFTPRYWKFPFLADADIQIGNTWTQPSHRGRGLAQFALGRILMLERRPGRKFWYVVGEMNAPSIRVIAKAGFAVVGRGRLINTAGIRPFGAYTMESPEASVGTAIENVSASVAGSIIAPKADSSLTSQ